MPPSATINTGSRPDELLSLPEQLYSSDAWAASQLRRRLPPLLPATDVAAAAGGGGGVAMEYRSGPLLAPPNAPSGANSCCCWPRPAVSSGWSARASATPHKLRLSCALRRARGMPANTPSIWSWLRMIVRCAHANCGKLEVCTAQSSKGSPCAGSQEQRELQESCRGRCRGGEQMAGRSMPKTYHHADNCYT